MRRHQACRFLAVDAIAAGLLLVGHLLAADAPPAKSNDGPSPIAAKEITAEERIREALRRPIELKYEETPLTDVAADLQKKLGVPVQLDRKALADVGVDADTPVTFTTSAISARSAVNLLLRQWNLVLDIEPETLSITSPEEAESHLSTKVLDVGDLVCRDESRANQADFDQLVGLIIACVQPVTWENVGGPGSIAPFQAVGIKAVVVRQTADVHEEIGTLLAQLRAIHHLPASKSDRAIAGQAKASELQAPKDVAFPEAEAAFRRAIAKPITFRFKDTSLTDIATVLRKKTGLPVIVDMTGFEKRTEGLSSGSEDAMSVAAMTADADEAPLGCALDQLLRPVDLTWTYHDGALVITTAARKDELLMRRSYDVSDLPSFRDKNGQGVPDYRSIMDTLTLVNPKQWQEWGGAGSMASCHKEGIQAIVVMQTWEGHRQIEDLLEKLRKTRGPATTAEEIAKLPLAPPSGTAYKRKRSEPTMLRRFEDDPPKPLEPDPKRDAIVEANNQFAFDLYKQMCRSGKDVRPADVFFSPLSLSNALAMVYMGARGQTADEMAKTLHLTLSQQAVGPAFNSLLNTMPAANHPGCRLVAANRLWGQQGFGFADSFLTASKEYFGAELGQVDFTRTNEVCREINAWCEKNTDGRIKGIIAPDDIQRAGGFVVTNAVYFKGRWSHQFEKGRTQAVPFFVGGEKTDVAMMEQLAECRYAMIDNVKVLEKTYLGGEIAMLVLLPLYEPAALTGLEQSLSTDKINDWLKAIRPQEVRLYLPRFAIESGNDTRDLRPLLVKLGMQRVFQAAQADLSGISNGKGPLWLDRLLHKAVVNVEEEGTEAAAVTAGIGGLGAPPPTPIFRADHPFVFLIRDTRTGNILFIGRVVNPEKAPPAMTATTTGRV